MTEPRWLGIEIVIAAHARQLERYGGPPGIRDRAALESALARPVNRFHYGESDPAVLAAAYGFGLARNHAFIDGNKRIAFIAMALFLQMNGHRLVAANDDAAAVVLRLAAGELDEGELAGWIRAHVAAAPDKDA
jgi:death-on-curing protein